METAKEEAKKSEIVISVANDSQVRINVNVYVNGDQLESSDLNASENIAKQFENLQMKVINVQTPSGRDDKMVLVSKQNYDDFIKYKKKKPYTEFLNSVEVLSSYDNVGYTKVVEINEDLFNVSMDYSLAHCVSEDLIMENGISLQFSAEFKRHGELFNQRQKQGGLAILSISPRFIYYLIVKKLSFHQPTLRDMWNSLIKMQKHVQENNVKQVAIPRIGCGFNGLEWSNVKFMIDHIFKGTDVTITVCNFKQKETAVFARNVIPKCESLAHLKPTFEIAEDSLIVYFGSEDGFINTAMKKMDEKFHILPDYNRGPRELRKVIRTDACNGSYLIIGFIVKKSTKDVLDYSAVEKCAQEVNEINTALGDKAYKFLAFDMFTDPPDEETYYNVLDILRITLTDVDVYTCFPKDYNIPYLYNEKVTMF